MRLYSVLLFYVCLNLAGFAISTLVVGNVLAPNAVYGEMPYGSTEILAQFNLATFTTIAAGAGIAGLIGLITKQYVFATGAALIWVLGCMFNVGQWLLNGFPRMIGILLNGTGIDVMISTILTTILTFYLFFFFAELLSQKPMVS